LLKTQTINSGAAVTFVYDNDDLLTNAGSETLVPDPNNGMLTGTTLGSFSDSYGYDTNGLLQKYTAQYGGTTLYSESITLRDGVGRIKNKSEIIQGTSHSWAYTYDPTGRLTDVSEDGQAVHHYAYDGDDNRTTDQTFGAGGTTIHPSYDAQDRLTAYGATTYGYGANGELQTKTNASGTTSYTYDVFGNLLHVGPPSGSAIDYVTDGKNRRVGKKVGGTLTTGFLYQDALNVVAQLDGSGNLLARYVFGSKRNVPDYYTTSSGTFRVVSDHLGSPRLVVNTSSGAVVEEIDYDEFGLVTNDTAPGTMPFAFAGGLYDKDTGLVRFGARDYDASVGRWTSKDPTRFSGGMNLFVYVGNDPVNVADPSGKLPPWPPPFVVCLLDPELCSGGGGGGGGGSGGSGGGGGGDSGPPDAGPMCGGIPSGNDNGEGKCPYTGYADAGTSAGMRQVICYYDCPGVGEVRKGPTSVYSGEDPMAACTDPNFAPNRNNISPWPVIPGLPMIPGFPIPVIP
jgi:RHS repeat-associated protein